MTSVAMLSSPVPILGTALQGNSLSFGIGMVGVGRNAVGVHGQSGATNGFERTLGGVRGYTEWGRKG